MSHDTALPLYRFDQADAQLSLLPMAARRALDCVGLHLSLRGWQALTIEQRQLLVRLGGAEQVDRAQVAQLLEGSVAEVRPTPPLTEADATSGPSAELQRSLPHGHDLDQERWRALSALDRYVLTQLAGRGKIERLAKVYAEICS
jgi:hypothetical protein